MESRFIPLTIAGIVCFGIAFFLGAGFWYFFGTSPRALGRTGGAVVQSGNQSARVDSTPVNSNADVASTPAQPPALTPAPKKAPAGEVLVEGGEIVLGGGETKLPVRRVIVEDFAIAETEVTNEQYAEFVQATGRRAPASWKDGKFLPGTNEEPVTGVTWNDANEYCRWLSEQMGATVRLPSEAEWERAARGNTDHKYPWGDEWNDEGAQSVEIQGKILPVKSLPAGRSPAGAYEMVGNVWEWTSDLAVDELGKPVLFEETRQRIIKGGSAKEERAYLTVSARAPRPENKASELLGFRYVIVRL